MHALPNHFNACLDLLHPFAAPDPWPCSALLCGRRGQRHFQGLQEGVWQSRGWHASELWASGKLLVPVVLHFLHWKPWPCLSKILVLHLTMALPCSENHGLAQH